MSTKLVSTLRSVVPVRIHDDLFRLSSRIVDDNLKHRYASGVSMWWSLENLKRCGFTPASVIDIGAFVGEWTTRTQAIWPEAKFLMIEPQPNKQERLSSLCSDLISLEQALLGSTDSDAVPFHMDDHGGSSVLEQFQNKCERLTRLPMKTLDEVVAARQLRGPILLKADVQGYELEVLRGATDTLRQVEVILLEVSLLPYNIGAPGFSDVVSFMATRQFFAYDFCSMHRRQSDETAFQVDVLFVHQQSALRSEKPFFLEASAQTRR